MGYREITLAVDALIGQDIPTRAGVMPLPHKMNLWQSLRGTEDRTSSPPPSLGSQDHEAESGDDVERNPIPYFELVRSSSAYAWFIPRFQRDLLFYSEHADQCCTSLDDIGTAILDHLSLGTVSRWHATPLYSATFRVPWRRTQARSSQEDQGIGDVMALTTSGAHTWGCPVKEYVEKVWPSLGLGIVDFLQLHIDGGCSSHSSKHTYSAIRNVNYEWRVYANPKARQPCFPREQRSAFPQRFAMALTS